MDQLQRFRDTLGTTEIRIHSLCQHPKPARSPQAIGFKSPKATGRDLLEGGGTNMEVEQIHLLFVEEHGLPMAIQFHMSSRECIGWQVCFHLSQTAPCMAKYIP